MRDVPLNRDRNPFADATGRGLDEPEPDLISAASSAPNLEPRIDRKDLADDNSRCCGDIDLAVSKETVGPVRVQIVYCENCEEVIEQVVGDE